MKPSINSQIYEIRGLIDWEGSVITFEQVKDVAWELINFLRNNALLEQDSLPKTKDDVTIDFKLMSNDVTEEGFKVLKLGFYKWLDSNDNINSKEIKMGTLEKALEKVRKVKG